MTLPEATARLHDAAVLWAAGYVSGAEVVRAACDVLVAGADGTQVAILAGLPLRHPDDELRDLLPAALEELGLPYFPGNTPESTAAALRVLAARTAAGDILPRELARWAHRVIGHGTLPIAESLVVLDDEYDMLEYDVATRDQDQVAEFDADVLREARRIASETGS